MAENETKPAKTETTEAPAFSLEQGIAIPPRTRAGGGASLYPFAEMAEGQTFLVPVEEPANIKDPAEKEKAFKEETRIVSNRVSGAIRRFRKTNPDTKFVQRTVNDGTAGRGVRIWRVAPDA